jgi:hypothetical protein
VTPFFFPGMEQKAREFTEAAEGLKQKATEFTKSGAEIYAKT